MLRPSMLGDGVASMDDAGDVWLHVPNSDLPAALAAIGAALRPGGLFFIGVYGADESRAGTLDSDDSEPKRYFSWRTDEQIQRYASEHFDIVDFHVVPVGEVAC